MPSIKKVEGKTGTSYKITVSGGRDSSGKQILKSQTYRPPHGISEAAAYKHALKLAYEIEQQFKNGFSVNEQQTFKEYAEYVIDTKKRQGLKLRTIERYLQLIERINPIIGHLKIKDIRPQHIAEMLKALEQDGQNKRSGGKLSEKTILEYHRLVSTILAAAEHEMLIPYNAAKKVTPPKVKKHEMEILQPEEIQQLFKCLEEDQRAEDERYKKLRDKYPNHKGEHQSPQTYLKWKLLTHLFLVTGCRRGELLGLKWDKVDFENRLLKIDNTLLYTKENKVYQDTPKTERSNRVISFPVQILPLLKEYKAWYDQLKEANGDRWNDENFVFVQDNGAPMHPDSPTDFYKKFSKKHGLPHLNPHKFRHTSTSLLIDGGNNIAAVSARIGHSNIATTMNIYAHMLKDKDKAAADSIGAALYGKTEV